MAVRTDTWICSLRSSKIVSKGGFDLLRSYNLEQDRWRLDQRENFLVVLIGKVPE